MISITNKLTLFSCLFLLAINTCSAGSGSNVVLTKDDDHHVYRAYDSDTNDTLAIGVAQDSLSAKQQLKDLESIGVENLEIDISDEGGTFVTKLFKAKELLNYYIYMHQGKSPSLQPDLFLLSVFNKFQFFLNKLY